MSQVQPQTKPAEPTRAELAEAARIEAKRCSDLNDPVGAQWWDFQAWSLENMQDMELSQ